LKDNIIKVCFISKYSTNDTNLIDHHLVNFCPIYKTIWDNILIEKQAPLKQSFYYLCKKAHYNIIVQPKQIMHELTSYFENLFEDSNLCYNYTNIPDVDSKQIHLLENKVCIQMATTQDKAIIKKYYFKWQFKNQNEELMEYAFDNRFDFFLEKLSKLKHDEEHLYHKIAEYNSWNSIFPTDVQLNKVKLNDELIDRIFKEYSFKDLKKNSSAKVIIKHIYNEFFSKTVIKTNTKDKKHYKLYISEDVHIMYDFGINCLKIYQKEQAYDTKWLDE
jgi:hypothetical protein